MFASVALGRIGVAIVQLPSICTSHFFPSKYGKTFLRRAAIARIGEMGERELRLGKEYATRGWSRMLVRDMASRAPTRPPQWQKAKIAIPCISPVNHLYLQARKNRTWREILVCPGASLGRHLTCP